MRNPFDPRYMAQASAYEAARSREELIDKLKCENEELKQELTALKQESEKLKLELDRYRYQDCMLDLQRRAEAADEGDPA